MKKADLRATLLNILLTAMVSVSGIAVFASAYTFPLDSLQVIGVCLLFAVITCVASRVRHGLWLLPVLVLVCGRQLWEQGLALHTEAVLWHISTMLDRAYKIGFVIWWTGNDHLGQDTTLFFMAIGIIAPIVTALGLSRHRTWPGILMGILLLMPSMLILNMGPKPIWLLILLAALLCLFLTRLTHRTDPANAEKMTLKALVCVAVLLGMLTACFHPDRYRAPNFSFMDTLLESLEQLRPTEPNTPGGNTPGGNTPGGNIGGSFTPDKVNLSRIGAKTFSYRFAFEVTCPENGWQYIRDTSFNTYTGTSWVAEREQEFFSVSQEFLQDMSLSMQLDTYNSRKTQFTPYYCDNLALENGKYPNADFVSVYSHNYRPLRVDWEALWRSQFGAEPLPQQWDVDPMYLELPEYAQTAALEILQELEIDSTMNTLDIAQAIGNFVRSSADYSLRTGRMPSGEEDFAIWFLKNSETGYCVHFATAAAVLLRAAGIPARYTTGYLVKTGADLKRVVYEGNAHAWVEYYLPGFGWMILEVTPGSTEPLPTQPTTEPSTDPTEEPTVPPTTKPDEPTTEPTKPTVPPTQPPTAPTVPGGSSEPEPFKIPDWVWSLLLTLLWIGLAVALVIAQWKLRLTWLWKRLRRGDRNQQALRRWRHANRLCRLRKETPPDHLLALANKARFSQHTLTEEELAQFDLFHEQTVELLRKRNIFLQFVYRIVLAIY